MLPNSNPTPWGFFLWVFVVVSGFEGGGLGGWGEQS